MDSSIVHQPIDVLPEEPRLVQLAKSGDADAFVQLYDAYVERVYRYIYYRVINDVAAEDITLHVFRSAWEQLARYRKYGPSYITWMTGIAKKLVIDYYKTDIKNRAVNVRTLETMAHYVEELNLGGEVRPSSTFKTLTRSWLTQYIKFHKRPPQSASRSRRMSMAMAGLVAMLFVSATIHAQAALPGEAFYGWKRTSEQAWRSVSFDPVGVDIALADRRLHEWIAVQNDPARSSMAMNDYFEELIKLKPTDDAQARARIVPALNTQKQILTQAGLSTSLVDNFLVEAAVAVVQGTPTAGSQTEVARTSANAVTAVALPASGDPTKAAPPDTQVPTEVVPTAVPTEIVPTIVPTEIVPTTVPTEVVPTTVPTEVVPTEVPTEVVVVPTTAATDVPPPTAAATEVSVPPTDIPPQATPVPEAPTSAPPTDAPFAPPTDAPLSPPTDAPGINAPADPSGFKAPTDAPAVAAPADSSGAAAPADAPAVAAPADASGAPAPAYAPAVAAPADSSGAPAPANASGAAAPADAPAAAAPTDASP